jgi:2-C-methyl-D-erythritol 4-phosphate cytidylyltransferase
MTDRTMIVVAAGRSLRFGTDKLMTPVNGVPLIAHTVAAVIGQVDRCILVCREDQIPALRALDLGVVLIPGGPSRTASELAGLSAVAGGDGLIGIHDGARPLVPTGLTESLFATAAEHGGAIPLIEPSIPLVHKADLSVAAGTAAYVQAARIEYEGHDSAEVAQRFSNLEIRGIPGDPVNIKVTFPSDLALVSAALGASRSESR